MIRFRPGTVQWMFRRAEPFRPSGVGGARPRCSERWNPNQRRQGGGRRVGGMSVNLSGHSVQNIGERR
jgi:hypothetical protein